MGEPTADDVRKTNMVTVASSHVVYVEAFRKLMGEEGLEAIGEENRLHGVDLGESALEEGSLRKGDLMSIFEMFRDAYPYFGFELSVADHTDSRLDLKVTKCPWIKTFRRMGAGKDICECVTKIDEGIAQAVDADLKMTLPKCMMRGDDYCIYRWQKEEGK
ncbi:hypothetical protein EU524_00980 [Candidatus Thorarchaeota archaeon]|jgi:hypothetical protein|nr:MAG: hypothetical protein EU524_00980 [Candidatus Thorarchaeota archaeon]